MTDFKIQIFIRKYKHNWEMIIDTKPRDFSYINHKNNQPLQLTGHMKQRQRPQSSSLTSKPHSISFGYQNCTSRMDEQIISNYKDLKSVIPIDLSVGKRKQSIKTYDKEKNLNISGAALLMVKSRVERDHPQKRHLTDRNWTYGYGEEQQKHKQRRHYEKNNDESLVKQIVPPRKHSNTLHKRLAEDIYSKIEVKQNILEKGMRMKNNSLFREGLELGYEHREQPRMSCAKRREMMGQNCRPLQSNTKVFRNDWRNSSFQLGW